MSIMYRYNHAVLLNLLSCFPSSRSLPVSLHLSLSHPLSLCLSLSPSLPLLSLQGIGDSGQGFANAILFVLFTPKVRRYFLRLLFCHCLWSKASREHVNIQNTAKIYYGTASSNSGYRSDASVEPPTVSEGLVLDKGKI